VGERTLLGESVYRRMRSDLLRGRIAPGQRVTEHWAAEHYRGSRTPVREACRRLAEEGLLAHRPRHGYWAPDVDWRELDELYEVRLALEVLSVRRACGGLGNRAGLPALRQSWCGEPPAAGEEVVYKDEAFHIGVARLGGNRHTVTLLDGVNARIRLVRVYDFLDEARIQATVEQHLAILETIEERDADRAAALMYAHISESKRQVVAAAREAESVRVAALP
jgi:DNA-binding GntR family transcriptional regulator